MSSLAHFLCWECSARLSMCQFWLNSFSEPEVQKNLKLYVCHWNSVGPFFYRLIFSTWRNPVLILGLWITGTLFQAFMKTLAMNMVRIRALGPMTILAFGSGPKCPAIWILFISGGGSLVNPIGVSSWSKPVTPRVLALLALHLWRHRPTLWALDPSSAGDQVFVFFASCYLYYRPLRSLGNFMVSYGFLHPLIVD